jgi:hypothetical protein
MHLPTLAPACTGPHFHRKSLHDAIVDTKTSLSAEGWASLTPSTGCSALVFDIYQVKDLRRDYLLAAAGTLTATDSIAYKLHQVTVQEKHASLWLAGRCAAPVVRPTAVRANTYTNIPLTLCAACRRPGLGQQAYTKDGALRMVAHAPRVGEGSHRLSVMYEVRGPRAPEFVCAAAAAAAAAAAQQQ